jgi:hypothetical protein
MPLTPQTREELKKSFLSFTGDQVGDENNTDWWLDRFDQLLIEKQERIESELKLVKNSGLTHAVQAYEIAINILKE